MSAHAERSIALAEKISAKAEDALSRLTIEMALMKWPAEFRVIMWDTVSHIASIRAQEARDEQ